MNSQTQATIFKYFTSKGEHFYSNEKDKREKPFPLQKFEIMNVFGKLPIISLYEKEKKKGKKPFQGKIRSCKGLIETPIFLFQCPT